MHQSSFLTDWGWNERIEKDWNSFKKDGIPGLGNGLIPGRVVHHVHHTYDCVTAGSDSTAIDTISGLSVSGRFSHGAAIPADYPTAGDWVGLDPTTKRIEVLLPRYSAFTRKVAGEESLEQVIVANIDFIFVVFGLDGGRNFVVSLVERALTAAWNSGASPVIVLNKVDTTSPEDRIGYQVAAEEVAAGAPVHLVSALTEEGLEELAPYLKSSRTVGLIGKSGVGKSALTNALSSSAILTEPTSTGGDIGSAETGTQRTDLQGRHTTTTKRLYRLPGGAVLADLPGLRELQLWADEDALDSAFPEIEELAAECRFRDCRHEDEPGCAVRRALEDGNLDSSRFERYLELRRELRYLERRTDQRAAREERDRWKQIHKSMKNFTRFKRGE